MISPRWVFELFTTNDIEVAAWCFCRHQFINPCKLDRQKAKVELNESDDLMQKISNLRSRIKDSDWFNAIFEERLDDQYLKRFLRVTKMNKDDALERLRKMFALQKGRKS